jgi:hypothetical protein
MHRVQQTRLTKWPCLIQCAVTLSLQSCSRSEPDTMTWVDTRLPYLGADSHFVAVQVSDVLLEPNQGINLQPGRGRSVPTSAATSSMPQQINQTNLHVSSGKKATIETLFVSSRCRSAMHVLLKASMGDRNILDWSLSSRKERSYSSPERW